MFLTLYCRFIMKSLFIPTYILMMRTRLLLIVVNLRSLCHALILSLRNRRWIQFVINILSRFKALVALKVG